jgi:hypothetical protein
MDVAKVDRDVTYVAMAIHVCYKRLFQMFHLFVRHILQVFYLDVANVLSDVVCVCNGFQVRFASVSDVCWKCFSFFGYMLQVLHLHIPKVDLVMHMLQCDPPATAACYSC